MSLLTTKLNVPPVPAKLVSRPRLLELADSGLGGKLTLVSAPAGFGKTTLVAEWLSRAQRPVAWLSLDEGDNDRVRFFTYLVAALQRFDPNIGQAARAMTLAPTPPPPESFLTSLINDIAASHHPFILVLDDYQVIHEVAIHQQLAFVLEHQPAKMHLVVATREDPPLPLSRWRGRGQAAEIRQADLRFTEEEADDFLRRVMRVKLSSADVSALHQRTEGWIAGLQLGALSLRGRDDVRQFVESFTGSHRFILDYLIEEVLQQQSADVQGFLLKTSILNRLSAPLCDAVTERTDSQELLLRLEQANLFIVPLDESRRWYRYHRLFAELLREQLRMAARDDEVPLLHGRASRWHEAAGFRAEAVHHAVAASDWERAGTLILDVGGSMLERGELMTLRGWLQLLPDDEVRSRPGLCIQYSWVLILTGQLDGAEAYLGAAEEAARDIPALLSDVVSAQAFIARARGDNARTIELSRRALSLLPEDDFAGRCVVAVNLGIALWSSGDLAQAEHVLGEADRAAQQSGNLHVRLTALSFLGVIQATWGRLHRAAEVYREAIRLGEDSPAIALAYLQMGALLLEWNDLESAADHLKRGLELGQRSGNWEVQIGGYRTLARLRQAQGDAPGALAALQEAHQLAHESDVPPAAEARNAACHVQIALAQGDMTGAMRWAEQVTEDADASSFHPRLSLTAARLLLAQGQKAAAAKELEAVHETAVGEGWQYGVIEVLALQALAAFTLPCALAFLTDVLALAQPEGYIRTFVDKGEPMAMLLRTAAAQQMAPEYVARLLAAFDLPEHMPGAPSLYPGVQPLIEPLSDRELDVLCLLADGQTNQEMARVLCVSVNTVKTHLKNIYGKLAVHSRREAASKARGMNLLP